jgi:F0F1-type ATP synthase membrane subunit a
MSIPFWFFELFVALIQALVFAGLTISYLSQAKEKH